MLCPTCSTEILTGSAFCSKCGTATASPAAAATPSAADQVRANRAAGAAASDTEQQLWHGGYSAKAMYGSWLLALLVTVAAVAASVLLANPIAWVVAGVVVGALWIVLAFYYLIARLSVDYTLTNQRLIHRTGILRQVTNRLEVIDIDDVTFVQGLVERMFNVGTIKLLSSDNSDPSLVLRGIDNVRMVAGLIDNARRDERRKRGLYVETV